MASVNGLNRLIAHYSKIIKLLTQLHFIAVIQKTQGKKHLFKYNQTKETKKKESSQAEAQSNQGRWRLPKNKT